MRTLQVIFCLLFLLIIGFIAWQLNLLYQTACDTSMNNIGRGPHFLQINESRGEKGNHIKCPAKTAIFFLKTHKCGSSTVQNILMRYGKNNHLSFVLSTKDNYVGNPEYFLPELIGSQLRLPDGEKYDIFTHHTRYNHEAIRSIMKEGAPFVTIMRDPIQLQLSLYSYYQLTFVNNGYSLPELLHINLTKLKQWPRFWYRVGWNQISWDLGVKESEMDLPQMFQHVANKVESEFNLVMITEFMEASLVLLADIMCWPLEEVRFISVNARYGVDNTKFGNPVLTDEETRVLEKLNKLDIQLYSHFKQRFKQLILEYGVDRMISDVKRLVDMNSKLYHDCIDKVVPPKKRQLVVKKYKLKVNALSICDDIVLPELNFTEALRMEQKKRIQVTNQMKDFLRN